MLQYECVQIRHRPDLCVSQTPQTLVESSAAQHVVLLGLQQRLCDNRITRTITSGHGGRLGWDTNTQLHLYSAPKSCVNYLLSSVSQTLCERRVPSRLLLLQRAIARRCTFHVTTSRARKPAGQRAACCRCQDEFTRRLRRGGGRMSDLVPHRRTTSLYTELRR